MDIKDIALKVAEELGAVMYSPAPLRAVRGYSFTYEQIEEFSQALVAEIQRRGEPVAFADSYGNVVTKATKEFSRNILTNSFDRPLFTFPPDKAQIEQAAIASYKAELLKEVGEPVDVFDLYSVFKSILLETSPSSSYYNAEQIASSCHDRATEFVKAASKLGINLFTSDQVAAAILKATKPLEKERDEAVKRMEAGWIEVCDSGILAFKEMNDELRQQLAAAQEEIERPSAIDAYETYMADGKEIDPVERLRFFLSLALKGKDWFDVEKFINDVSDQLATAEQRVAEACAKLYLEDYDLTDIADRVRSGEYRKFMKEV